MGLFNKLKNVLFEEEEIEIPVMTKEEPKEEIPVKKEKSTKVENVRLSENIEKEEPKPIVEIEDFIAPTLTMEREIFKSEPTFEFPVFDEEDFTANLRSSKSNNVLDKENKEKKHRKLDFGKYNKKEEVTEDSKKFKPSPIISPVYGILDQNYKKEDVKKKDLSGNNEIIKRQVDVDSIRTKAFGTLADDIENTMKIITNNEYKETTTEIPITKTIDELLMNSIDEEITVDTSFDTKEVVLENTEDMPVLKEIDSILDNLDSDVEESKLNKEKLENDTLETDLFNLIDSMYDNGKDEEND